MGPRSELLGRAAAFILLNAASLSIILVPSSAGQAAEPLLPDLIAWETTNSPYYMHDGSMDVTTIPNKVLYRFSQPIPNIGDGPLELREVTHPNQVQDIDQRIYDSEGAVSEVFVGSFPDADPPYGHLYLVGIAEYRLRTVTSGNGVGPVVATKVKTSYGLYDSVAYNTALPGAPPSARYNGSDPLLGISVGWTDVYPWYFAGQWIDVTGLAGGQYWLEAEIDPDDLIEETDDSNNVTRVLVDLVVPEPNILPGDYNQDDMVDATDFIVWRKTLGQDVSTGTAADGNGNGRIDAADYAVWSAEFGTVRSDGNGSSSASVPEPSSIGLAALSLCVCSRAMLISLRRRTVSVLACQTKYRLLTSGASFAPNAVVIC